MKYLLHFIFILTTFNLSSQNFSIQKIEPPFWWTGMKWNEVQLMVYGKNLQGISVSCNSKNIKIVKVHELENTDYTFVDIAIAPGTIAKSHTLFFEKEGRQTPIQFVIKQRADNESCHQGFDQEDVVYLVTPDRFAQGGTIVDDLGTGWEKIDRTNPEMRHGGNLKGIENRLDYLVELGITTIWLNPVLENKMDRGSYHGYAATDMYNVDPRFGTNKDYQQLVRKSHEKGIKVIYDHVANHVGINHPWIDNPPTEDWIHGTRAHHVKDKHYMASIVDPHADPKTSELLDHFWFVDVMPDMNQQNPFLKKYLIQNMIWWIEYTGLDGIREDTYPYANQEFLKEWNATILDEYPNLNIVGEVWNHSPAIIAQFQKGVRDNNLPALMDFPLMDACRKYLTRKGRLQNIYEVFTQDFLYDNPNNLMTFFDNHDTPRGIFISNGNTAKIKQCLTIVMTTRGIPQLLYGTEINMVGGEQHVALREDFPGGFEGDERNAFDPKQRTSEENDMWNFIQQLLQLRKKYPALSKGKMTHYPLTWDSDVYKYFKTLGEEKILVIVNGHDQKKTVDFSEIQHQLDGYTSFKNLFSNNTTSISKTIEIEKWGVNIYLLTK